MILRKLCLKNFRNISGEFDLNSRINIIIGKNGLGKTNFLESIYFLSSGRSFRTRNEVNTINSDILENSSLVFGRIEGDLEDELGNKAKREVILEKTDNMNGNGCRKNLKVNGVRKSKIRFISDFHTILFSPVTVNLVLSSPSVRRTDLDDFLSIYDEEYLQELFEYRKILRNRNKLLEKLSEKQGLLKELNYWNENLFDIGSRIIFKRKELLDEINPLISEIAPDLFNLKVEGLEIDYQSKFIDTKVGLDDIKAKFEDKISRNYQKEIYAGRTLYGPQREDFKYLLNKKDLKEFGSRGQQRLYAFLYKIAQWKLLSEKQNRSPILLLDDLFSELDDVVRKRVCRFLSEIDNQVIITTTTKDDLDDKWLKDVYELSL